MTRCAASRRFPGAKPRHHTVLKGVLQSFGVKFELTAQPTPAGAHPGHLGTFASFRAVWTSPDMARKTYPLEVHGLLEPGPVVLLTTASAGKSNVMAMSFFRA